MAAALTSRVFAAPTARPAAGPRRVTCMAASPGNWCPGLEKPAYLEGLPGNYGYDPLKLGKDEASLARFREAEIIHGRWAMLGTAGCLVPELLGMGDMFSAPEWVKSGESASYFGMTIPFSFGTIAVIQFVLMAGAEAKRQEETDPIKRIYPGGAFDPLGFSKDPASLETLQLKELKNGRLAMFSFLGYIAQHAACGGSPVANWSAHVADPWNVTFASNGVSVPGL